MITVFKDTHTNKNEAPYNPLKLYQVMRQDNKDLLNGKQQDAKEFWMRITEVMDNDKNSSKFLFAHNLTTIVKCELCQTSSQTEHKVVAHIIEVGGRLTVQEAVDAYFAEEVLETYACEVCKRINIGKAKKKCFVKSAPKVLCLMLNRLAKNDEKIADNIGLNYQLKLSEFLLANKATHITYKLVSTINHIGTNISNGHYTATACCSSHSFYEFDDSRVHSVDAISGSDAYILIYELSTKVFFFFCSMVLCL